MNFPFGDKEMKIVGALLAAIAIFGFLHTSSFAEPVSMEEGAITFEVRAGFTALSSEEINVGRGTLF